jgi:hypothetical protein
VHEINFDVGSTSNATSEAKICCGDRPAPGQSIVALRLARRENGALGNAGKVGTGFDALTARSIRKALDHLSSGGQRWESVCASLRQSGSPRLTKPKSNTIS